MSLSKEKLINLIKSTIKEEIKNYLYENISIKNNLDTVEILFLKGIKDQEKLKQIISLLKKYKGIENVKKTNNGMVFKLKDNLSTTEFITFVTEIKNKLGFSIKRENKNIYIVSLT